MSVVARAPVERFAVRVAVALFTLAAVVGCSDGQDPGLDPSLQPSGDQPATTSNTLGRCPPDGPDATTPPAGCIGPDGQVLRP